VHVFQTLEHLVDYVLFVDVFEDVGADHSMQVRVHKVKHQVDVTVVFSSHHVLQTNDVFMPRQLLQEDNLAEGALRISRILKGVEVLFEGNDLLGALVNCFPDNAVSTLTKFLEDFVFF